MESKKSLGYMYKLVISNTGDFKRADKVRECYNKIADDLDLLEEYKKILGTPIQAIRKDLKLLEEIRNCVLTFDEFSGVPASLVLKKIRELIFDGK